MTGWTPSLWKQRTRRTSGRLFSIGESLVSNRTGSARLTGFRMEARLLPLTPLLASTVTPSPRDTPSIRDIPSITVTISPVFAMPLISLPGARLRPPKGPFEAGGGLFLLPSSLNAFRALLSVADWPLSPPSGSCPLWTVGSWPPSLQVCPLSSSPFVH